MESARVYGLNEVLSYNDRWLKKTLFYKKNLKILDQKRGAGFWLWKPYVILDAMESLNFGDVLVYTDSGLLFINKINYFDKILCETDIVLFKNDNHINSTWTKRDCFFYMGLDTEEYHNGQQVAATYMLFRKSEYSISFIKEWLFFATDSRIITDSNNECGLNNFNDFIDHRHDQSVLSLLAIKHKLELFRDPSQWGNQYKLATFKVTNEFVHHNYYEEPMVNSPYPTIFYSHRLKLPLNFLDYFRWYCGGFDFLNYKYFF